MSAPGFNVTIARDHPFFPARSLNSRSSLLSCLLSFPPPLPRLLSAAAGTDVTAMVKMTIPVHMKIRQRDIYVAFRRIKGGTQSSREPYDACDRLSNPSAGLQDALCVD